MQSWARHPGYCTIEDGVIAMTDGDGVPVRCGYDGEMVAHRLFPGENPKVIAPRLTLKLDQ